MNATEIANSGIVTQLAVVHSMLPKVKEMIDKNLEEIESLRAQVKHLESQVYGGTTK